jgi:hypothetical protein
MRTHPSREAIRLPPRHPAFSTPHDLDVDVRVASDVRVDGDAWIAGSVDPVAWKARAVGGPNELACRVQLQDLLLHVVQLHVENPESGSANEINVGVAGTGAGDDALGAAERPRSHPPSFAVSTRTRNPACALLIIAGSSYQKAGDVRKHLNRLSLDEADTANHEALRALRRTS